MITGFSHKTTTGQWYANYRTAKNYTFKKIYENNLGYLIKVGKKDVYLTKEQTEEFEDQIKRMSI